MQEDYYVKFNVKEVAASEAVVPREDGGTLFHSIEIMKEKNFSLHSFIIFRYGENCRTVKLNKHG